MARKKTEANPASDDAEAILNALTETSGLLSETATHLIENAVPAEDEAGFPTSFNAVELPLARILSESSVPVARAAPASALAAPEFAQLAPQLAPR